MTKSTSGMALMSRMTDRQVDKLCRHINYYELGPDSRVDIREVMKELAWIRKVGYCYIEHRPVLGISSLAFPLGETLHGIPLALGVGGVHDRIASRKAEIVATIRETIAEFKRQPVEDDTDHTPKSAKLNIREMAAVA